ncbi:MAG TPA: hypothetical protein VL403_18125 [Candidatus Kryptonia bacterium]|nr:hypothetical protein [Candidatus Kryptonia bacterium]
MYRLLLVLPILLVAACSTPWQKHTAQLHDAEAQHDIDGAMTEERWLIDHAFEHAPPSQRGARAEMDRYLKLADLAAEAGDIGKSIEVLRQALQTDSSRYREVEQRLARLPLSPADRKQVEAEFRWNIYVLEPGSPPPEDAMLPCWSYRVREVHVRTTEVHQGIGSAERRISYDARSWVYDAAAERWRADGDWVKDISAETERVGGPPRSRYRAITAADGGFFAEGPVPPCHRSQWTGPFDSERDRLFVASELPSDAR